MDALGCSQGELLEFTCIIRRLAKILKNKKRLTEPQKGVFKYSDPKTSKKDKKAGAVLEKNTKPELDETTYAGTMIVKNIVPIATIGKGYQLAVKSAKTKFDDGSVFFQKSFNTEKGWTDDGFQEYLGLIAEEVLSSGDVKLKEWYKCIGDHKLNKDTKELGSRDEAEMKLLGKTHLQSVTKLLQKEYEKFKKKIKKEAHAGAKSM